MVDDQRLPAGSLDAMAEPRADVKARNKESWLSSDPVILWHRLCNQYQWASIQELSKLVAGPDAAVGMATVGALAPRLWIVSKILGGNPGHRPDEMSGRKGKRRWILVMKT